jgi:hypothetical protein
MRVRMAAIACVVLGMMSCAPASAGPLEPAVLDDATFARAVSLTSNGVVITNTSNVRRYFNINTTEWFTLADWAPCVSEPWCVSLGSGESMLVRDEAHWTRGVSMSIYFWSAEPDGRGRPVVDPESFVLKRFNR